MAILMQDDGFRGDDWAGGVVPLAEAGAAGVLGIDLDPGEDLTALAPYLGRIALIRVRFGGFADGRGFTVARRLRAMGYTGACARRGRSSPINMRWHGARALTRSRWTPRSRPASPRNSGWRAQTGARATIRRG